MKSKTLMAVAVASTFGWSAASFAGSSHEVVTPFSPNESGQNIFSYQHGFGSNDSSSTVGALSDAGSGTLSGAYGSTASNLSTSGDESAAIAGDDSLAAANEGMYSDFYVVSLAPVTSDSWDYYVIDDARAGDPIAASDVDVWTPAQDQLVLIPSTTTNSDEIVYELALIPMTFDDNGLSTGMTDDLSGE